MENVEIVDSNGNVMTVEPVLYFKVLSTGKKYLFYTLNEIVDGLIRIYYAETSDTPGQTGMITDSDKVMIRDIMTKIVSDGDLSELEFIPLQKKEM